MKKFKLIEEGRLNRNDLVNLKGGDGPIKSCEPIGDLKFSIIPCYAYTFCPKYTNCLNTEKYTNCHKWEDVQPCKKFKGIVLQP